MKKMHLLLFILFVMAKNSLYSMKQETFEVENEKKTATCYTAVDLGLSVKWASFNVGATKPEETGNYYAWGETEEKECYIWKTYKYGTFATIAKYGVKNSYGFADYEKTLEPADDVARAEWGGSWRMPTTEEQDELRKKCEWKWTVVNGVCGYKVTAKNGNSIFLPAAGFCHGFDIYGKGVIGRYWANSLHNRNRANAYSLYFYKEFSFEDFDYRYYGFTVRPVCK